MLTDPESRRYAAPAPARPLGATDRCVMCGMCLPHCPTYAKTRNEGDSPRGRIALMQALDRGELEPQAGMLAHLDGCLACRACEAVCPSGVPYGELIDAARERLHARRPRPLRARAFSALARPFIEHRGARRAAALALRLGRGLGLIALARTLRLDRLLGLSHALELLPPSPLQVWRRASRPEGRRGRVALFTGCAGEVLDAQTLEATTGLLQRLGYAVQIPTEQTCCGAIYQHNGEPQRARPLLARNLAAFADPGLEAVIATASGCTAQLAEYHRLAPGPEAQTFVARLRDVSRFLDESGCLEGRRFRPLPKRVALHTPCSLAYPLKGGAHPARLLARIPGLELLTMPEDGRCCGAAGAYVLTQPEMSDRLREDKLRSLRELQPDILVTSNIGCALHLQAGIRAAGLDIEVLHPVVLLARQLED